MVSDTRRLLLAARGVIKTPDTWAQKHAAVNRDNTAVNSMSSTACRWCGIGALDRASADIGTPAGNALAAEQLLHRTAKALYGLNLVQVNDRLGHDEVMAVYNEALRRTP
jgi:hypothetical protein